MPNKALVNCTTNVKHEIKMRGLEKKSNEGVIPVAEALGISGDVTYYWILPKPQFDEACKAGKPFVVKDPSETLPGETLTVRQYFVCVPFTSTLQ